MKNKMKWISENPQCKQIESCYNSLSKKCICPTEQPKEMSLEKVGENLMKNSYGYKEQKPFYDFGFKKGYNHASKTLYTESEVLELLIKSNDKAPDFGWGSENLQDFFNQHKKKL